MTKQQQIDVLKTENEQLRAQLAASFADNAMLNRKLFQLNSERAKWEARARAAQSTYVNAPHGSFAERAAYARDEAMRTGRAVAVGV